MTYDAILLASFGGPEGPDDVIPFLENVTVGRNIPRERLEVVGQHYFRFGGVSPINQQNLDLIDELRHELKNRGVSLPIYFGNRNWKPYFVDAINDMQADAHQRIGHRNKRVLLLQRLSSISRKHRKGTHRDLERHQYFHGASLRQPSWISH